MKIIKTLIENFNVKETKIQDEYNPKEYEAVNLDFFIDDTQFGEASISGINTNDAFLYNVGIYPWFRGKGYANQMLDYILKNYNVTNLIVSLDNIPAINLYKKYGFKINKTFNDNGKEMYVMIKESLNEDKDFIPENVKKDTCVAVAYSMLTGIDYDDALKMFPNGKYETLNKKLDLIEPNEKENTLNSFLLTHPSGRYLVSIIDKKHHDGHAIAVIDGVAYNIQDFDKNSEVAFYSDLSKTAKIKSKETSYLDELDKHKNIKDNKYINYAYQKLIDKFKNDLNDKGTLRTTVRTNSTDGFELKVNNKSFKFKFPFNCSETDIYKEIDNIIEKSIV